MVKVLLVTIGALYSFTASAASQPRHMVKIQGESAFIGASRTSFSPSSASTIDSMDITVGNFYVNYAHRLGARFQLGVSLGRKLEETSSALVGSPETSSEDETVEFSVFGIFNFSTELNKSFYLGVSLGFFNTENKDSGDKVSGTGFGIIHFGKRFPLTFMGIENLTYSPNISISKLTFRDDFEAVGLEDAVQVGLNILAFDLLF